MKTNENPATLRAEREIADRVMPWLNYRSSEKLPRHYALDFALGKYDVSKYIHAYLECKWRPGLSFGDYDGLCLSLAKVMRGREIHSETGFTPCWLAVRPDNGIVYICDLFAHRTGSRWFGRIDREDEDNDLEPCVVYAWDIFREIGPT